jgi:hypothetical protein
VDLPYPLWNRVKFRVILSIYIETGQKTVVVYSLGYVFNQDGCQEQEKILQSEKVNIKYILI